MTVWSALASPVSVLSTGAERSALLLPAHVHPPAYSPAHINDILLCQNELVICLPSLTFECTQIVYVDTQSV